MTNSESHTPDTGNLRDEALAWIRRLNTGEASDVDIAELDRWRAKSPEHAREFSEAALLWTVLGEAAKKAAAQGLAPAVNVGSGVLANRPGRRAFLIGGGALAASVAGALAVRPPFGLWPSLSELTADYHTKTGERQRIDVAAHVSVDLNTRTSIDLRSAAQIELLAGEAAIAKKDDSRRELVVFAGNGRVAATDASFNVRKDGSAVSVTCISGEVHVHCGPGLIAIREGQQIDYDQRGLGEVAAIDPEVVTAWQRGLLIFRRTPLSQVIDEMNRYRSGRIILLDGDLAQRQVVANFRLDRIDDAVEFISKAMNVPIRSLPGGIVLVG